jgi:hypothetical protein
MSYLTMNYITITPEIEAARYFWTAADYTAEIDVLELDRTRCQAELRYALESVKEYASILNGRYTQADINAFNHFTKRVAKWASLISELESDICQLVSDRPAQVHHHLLNEPF